MTVERYEQVQTCPLKCALRNTSLISLSVVCTLHPTEPCFKEVRTTKGVKGRQKTKRDFSNNLPVASFVVLMNPFSIEIHGGCIPCIIETCYCEFVMPHINILNEKYSVCARLQKSALSTDCLPNYLYTT